MRFEESIEIEAPRHRVWEVLSDLEAWPDHIETVEVVEMLTPGPPAVGSKVRLRQPKLPEGTWDITVWDPPSFFEFRQKSGGVGTTAGHRVEELADDRSRLTLILEMKGGITPIVGLFFKELTQSYMNTEARGIKKEAESPGS
jgi:uncharacterized membrane protein